MIESLKSWIVTILISAFIVNIVDMMLPNSKLKPYINLVINFIFVFIIVTPIINLFSNNVSFEDKILSSIAEYSKEYVQSSQELAIKSGASNLESGYENGLKSVLKLKLDDYGYDLEDIEFDGNNISNIKIKENNNSNKNEKEDIQSSKDEKTEQVFKEDKEESPLKEEELKEDLVKILDVSIETIEID